MSITLAPTMQVLCKDPSNRMRAEGLAARIAAALDRMTETASNPADDHLLGG